MSSIPLSSFSRPLDVNSVLLKTQISTKLILELIQDAWSYSRENWLVVSGYSEPLDPTLVRLVEPQNLCLGCSKGDSSHVFPDLGWL